MYQQLFTTRRSLAVISSVVVLSVGFPISASAQSDDSDLIEEIVTLGTRTAGRTATESPVPVDAFNAELLSRQGSGDMNETLSVLVPSFNVTQQSISDGSSFIRPATLRGMAPDHTLVLVNGKRFHRSAVVHLTPGSGAQGRGTQGPDIANIPSIALKRVEVLRDGAAAQYGSDAIAGVVNFVLRDNSEGLDARVQFGQFIEDSENQTSVAANLGLPLGRDGFFNISGEFTTQDELSRGNQHNAAATLLAADPSLPIANPAQIWGRPEGDSYRTFWNGAASSGADGEIYFFGNYSETESTGSFFYRPITGVVAGVGRGDVFGVDPVTGACVQLCTVFPGGFTPRFTGKVTDFSQVAGYRGDLSNGLSYDLSYNFGSNEVEYTIANTVNPALGDQGAATQTSFRPGALEQNERNVNIDLSYPLSDRVNLAGGLEWRKETYQIVAGERASWDGDPALSVQGFAVGSNGFGGFTPETAGEFSRENVAAYVDLEWEASDRFLLNAAIRFEDFTDFGTTTNGKLAARFDVTDSFLIRGAVSTGFKAPTQGQAFTSQVSTLFVDNMGVLEQTQVATLPVNNPVAVIMGSVPLDAEESDNLSFGAAYTGDRLTLTMDYYSIDVNDRIGLTSTITPDAAQQVAIDALNLPQNFSRVAYFTNAFSTETQGIDVVATFDLTDNTVVNLAYGWNETEVVSADSRVVNRERQAELEEGLPQHKANITITHDWNDWQFLARANYFGSVLDAGGTPATDEEAGSEIIFDIEATYNINDRLRATLGAKNLLNEFPDVTQLTSGPASTGLPYFRQSPVGFNGGTWYLRLDATLF